MATPSRAATRPRTSAAPVAAEASAARTAAARAAPVSGSNRAMQAWLSASPTAAPCGEQCACSRCRTKRQLLQTKLKVGPAGDALEQEADRLARSLSLTAPTPTAGAISAAPTAVQRDSPAGAGHWVGDDFARDLGAGQPLAPELRQHFEQGLGHGLGGVRIHTGARAAAAANEVGARAFTVGQDIAFGAGEYSPQTGAGRELLAHELVHVAQQAGGVRLKPKDPAPAGLAALPQPAIPKSDDIKDVVAFFDRYAPGKLVQFFVVKGSRLGIYDKAGTLKESFDVRRPGMVDVSGYYVGHPSVTVGWASIFEGEKGELAPRVLTEEGLKEMGYDSELGETLRRFDQEFEVQHWIRDEDKGRFYTVVKEGVIGMAIVTVETKEEKSKSEVKPGPVLRTDYPDWFRDLKRRVDAAVAADRQADKHNPLLPESLSYYGSEGVQAQRGGDAWTIQVNKSKRWGAYTVTKAAWDAATDKDAYTADVKSVLYGKVKRINDGVMSDKEEAKELSQIDGRGAAQKGSPWAWAVKLKKAVQAQLDQEKLTQRSATDFPDKLTLSLQGEGAAAQAHLRVWVYEDAAQTKPGDPPAFKAGTLPLPLQQGDKATQWAPMVRKAADALRRGAVTEDPAQAKTDANAASADGGQEGKPGVLPPYPSRIVPRNMNPDRSTATTATNNFRMVLDTAAVHGSNLLHLTTLHMGMNIGFGWKVFNLPEELKPLMGARGADAAEQLQDQANEVARTRSETLGSPKTTFDPDFDWEQSMDMAALGEGSFLLVSRATVAYPTDWNMQRQASVAALPFSVQSAEAMGAQVANADSDARKKLQAELDAATDDKHKAAIAQQIKELDEREGSDLLTLTQRDAKETQTLLSLAEELKAFIENERKLGHDFSGTQDYDPFLFRLKKENAKLPSVYLLVRQVFDYRYSDLSAVQEYINLLQKQLDDTNKLHKRTLRVTDNPQLSEKSPQYRAVAGLVRKDDGNLLPIILVAGQHKEAAPAEGRHKMLLMDVTFDSPNKGDMTYAGEEKTTEKDAVHSAFVKFGEDNQYGNGQVVYRVPQKGYGGQVPSVTTATEYLGYALAVIGVALLIAGAILSAGALAPASAAAIGAVVTALGISVGVAGAVLAAHNIAKRRDKGTFELDAEFALDVIAIIGAAVQVVSTAGKLSTLSRGMGAAQRVVRLQRLEKVLVLYGGAELSSNVVLVSLKVKEDVDKVKALHLPPEQEADLLQQIAMEAVQEGGMLAFGSFSHVRDIADHVQARIENARYRSLTERGWFDAQGKPTDQAPPALREHAHAPGKPPGKAAQGPQAWKETQLEPLAAERTVDTQHQLTLTESGRIIRCSAFCTDLRLKYGKVLGTDPDLHAEVAALEARAKQAAAAKDKAESKRVVADAAALENKLKMADDLRLRLFGMTDADIDAAFASMEAGHVSGGVKSGHKIDGTRVPRRQRRQLDVTDLMTDAEIANMGVKTGKGKGKKGGGFKQAMDRINTVMTRKISDIPELKKHWDAAAAKLLKGKQPTDYKPKEVIDMYGRAQPDFWRRVQGDPEAVKVLQMAGLGFEEGSIAAVATLGTLGKKNTDRGALTVQERKVSLDHIAEKAQGDNWKRALDADNLEFMFQNANSWKEIVQMRFKMRDE